MISSVLRMSLILPPFTSIKCTTIGIGIFYEKSEINIVSKPSASWALAMNQLFNNQILNLHFLLNKRILKILNFKLKIIVETWYHKFTKVIHNHQLSGSNLVYLNLLLKASKAIPRSLNGNVKSFPGQYFDGCNFMSCHHTNFAVWKDILLAFRFLT